MIKIKKPEGQTIEYKRDFQSQYKKELFAMLNSAELGTEVTLYIGVNDDGTLNDDYKPKDPSEIQDLFIAIFQENGIEHSIENLSNGGVAINAISNKTLLLYKGKIYNRSGSTTSIIKEGQYKKIITDKEIELLTPTKNKYDISNFSKLEEFLANKGIDESIIEFLEGSVCVMTKKDKITTTLANFVSDDSNLSVDINGVKHTGPIFELIELCIRKLLSNANIKNISKDRTTRKTIIEENPNVPEIIREMVSNLFSHSRFKLMNGENVLWIKFKEFEFTCINFHINQMMQSQIERGALPVITLNQPLVNLLRRLRLTETRGIGFKTFQENQKYITYNITSNQFKITYKGDL
ncbi:RNA-binding domain-containing protein [Mycoplasma todarodis]|uniref:Schlafen AlbA-2 domain-containing protein n=1 Tax=Mycoplasma todarodis TaxID=1937191 RepID=A0A4R0XST5_9MOLU|nr:RNA-binding domain-containing protein [Mycoplasma todarodis]TCG11952.1 hypothetical protein C4B25_00410 [Mycoplasma todarodis]